MRTLEFGRRTVHIGFTRTELELVVSGLLRLLDGASDPHEFLDRTGTSPVHLSTITGELQGLRRRMEELRVLEEEG